jgi:hypothetical protein
MPEVTVLSLADRDAWNAEHRDGGLPSQSWRYASALSVSGVDPKLAIVRSGGSRMLMPFVERHWSGSTDIATLVGASGASLVGESAAPLSLWREFAVGQGWVTGYIQLSPCLPLPECPQPQDQLVTSNVVFVLDLRADDLVKSWSPSLRHKIRKADDLGTTLTCDRSVLAETLKNCIRRCWSGSALLLGTGLPRQPSTRGRATRDRWYWALGATTRSRLSRFF